MWDSVVDGVARCGADLDSAGHTDTGHARAVPGVVASRDWYGRALLAP
ncbi:MAG TPA: hypothetical protein VJT31_00720 [Rugosimonospora sp.]|nr:hypothetical protein [Rugosimonospora sp.]